MNRNQALGLLPPYQQHKDVTATMGFGTNGMLVKAILAAWPAALKQTRSLAPRFDMGSQHSSAKAVWDFLKTEIKYKEDPGTLQHIKMPNALLATGSGDCKSYAVFASAIMANLGYPVTFRFAGYNGASSPGHVYTVVGAPGNQTIIDAVWRGFNSEKRPYSYLKNYPMEIATISGIGCAQCRGVGCANCQDIGKIQLAKVVQKAKQVAQQVKQGARQVVQQKPLQVIKSIVGAAPRTAFLQLVKLNVHGFATRLAARRNEALAKWSQLGGMTGELNASINAGQQRKPILGLFDGYTPNQRPIGSVEGIAALLTAAAPIIAALASLLKKAPASSGTSVFSGGEGTAPPYTPLPPGGDFGDGSGEITRLIDKAGQVLTSNLPPPPPAPSGGNTFSSYAATAPTYGGETTTPAGDQAPAAQGTPGWLLPVGLGLAALFLLK